MKRAPSQFTTRSIARFDHACGRPHPGCVEAPLEDLFPQEQARLDQPWFIKGGAPLVKLGEGKLPAAPGHRVELDQGYPIRGKPLGQKEIEEPGEFPIVLPGIVPPHLDMCQVADLLNVGDDEIEGALSRDERPEAVVVLPRSVQGHLRAFKPQWQKFLHRWPR